MMKNELLKVSLRQNALAIPADWIVQESAIEISETTSVLAANCSEMGYAFSEELLIQINRISPKAKLEIFELLKEITGVNKNWTPLVKQWDNPTGESRLDHAITWFANVFHSKKGTNLPCGHTIPENTFPMERYNGCPFCGTPFEFSKLDYKPSKNNLKVLDLWMEEDLKKHLATLLESPVALDATQIDNLKILIKEFGVIQGLEIKMKETLMIVIDCFVEQGSANKASVLFKSPNDILRYLWYKHTGFLQIVEPKVIANRLQKNATHLNAQLDNTTETKIKSLKDLKLKFSRTECKIYAKWLNGLSMSILDQCESMHPKRGIWVRVIRALRLAEYSKASGYEQLSSMLDTFYNEKYEVWQGKVNMYKLKVNADATFALLKERPGLFARSLFSTMLWFGPDETIKQFEEVMFKVPARLIFTLNMYADVYFDKNGSRTVKPLGGISKRVSPNKMLQLYSDQELKRMQKLIQGLSLKVIKAGFAKTKNSNTSIYIEEALFNIPIAIGDRNEQLQDQASALMGTRFKVEGDKVRLFLQWGEGLPAQHLDMDLSCTVAYGNKNEYCSYSNLVIPGCKHSGDIQYIPNKVGTAEYIEIDIDELKRQGAYYVSFACNAYTNGSLSPNLTVGWMNSKSPMRISKSGVAYDPTAVQQQVRVKETLTKGMVFGVLDVEKRDIIWLEMCFGGQIVQNLSTATIEGLVKKLDAKLKIGDLLKLKADVQGLKLVMNPDDAEEVYDMKWALNAAQVSNLILC